MILKDYLEQNNLHQVVERYTNSSFAFYDKMGISLLDFMYDPETDFLSTEIIPQSSVQGHEHIVHGGIVATYIDTLAGVHAMIHAMRNHKKAFTKELKIIYKEPMVVGNAYQIVSTHKDKSFTVEINDSGKLICQGELIFAFK